MSEANEVAPEIRVEYNHTEEEKDAIYLRLYGKEVMEKLKKIRARRKEK